MDGRTKTAQTVLSAQETLAELHGGPSEGTLESGRRFIKSRYDTTGCTQGSTSRDVSSDTCAAGRSSRTRSLGLMHNTTSERRSEGSPLAQQDPSGERGREPIPHDFHGLLRRVARGNDVPSDQIVPLQGPERVPVTTAGTSSLDSCKR